MPKGPIRRAQLISPFGVGAMMVVRDGTSVMTAGLDHWFKLENEDSDGRHIDVEEYKFDEWRLQSLLNVSHFRLPPDYRTSWRTGKSTPNCWLTVPFVRFPKWHFCPSCHTMRQLTLFQQGKQRCMECNKKGHKRFVLQVPFVAVCAAGHIQDFPWREWVHQMDAPQCELPMKLTATGGASLSAQRVSCECGASRNLSRITEESDRGTVLSRTLRRDNVPFMCSGYQPWLGSDRPFGCGEPLKGSLRNAANVYYADEKSAIYIPRATSAPSKLVDLLQEPPLSTFVNMIRGFGAEPDPGNLRSQQGPLLQEFSDAEIEAALTARETDESRGDGAVEADDSKTAFRRVEYNVLSVEQAEPKLKTSQQNLTEYQPETAKFFSQIMLVEKLRETRVFAGFDRIRTGGNLQIEDKKRMLRRKELPHNESWLPAYIVHGEGILLSLKEQVVSDWESQECMKERAARLTQNYNSQASNVLDQPLSARFLLLHTLSHLLINELTFECGYSSAALRERIFVSNNPEAPMAGILIYTAAGDSEGTLGGLVRMGKPKYFEPLLLRALQRATWCSADPICLEFGDGGGQGPHSCNLAACHNCALLPETACEEFNRFLDRGTLIGGHTDSSAGYFSELLTASQR